MFKDAFKKAIDWVSKPDALPPAAPAPAKTSDSAAATAAMLAWIKNPDDETFGKKLKGFLVEDAQINGKDEEGNTGLILVTALDRPQPVAKFFIEQGATVNAQNDAGWSALMYAAAENKSDIVDWLIHVGAYVSLQNREGKTAHDLATVSSIQEKIAETAKVQEKNKPEPVMALENPLTISKPFRFRNAVKLNA